MRTDRSSTIPASPLDVNTGGGCPKVNKFEQVSSLGHQMSLASYPVWYGGWGPVQEDPPTPIVNRITDTQIWLKTLPSRNFVGGW